jgi:hypothetical protein
LKLPSDFRSQFLQDVNDNATDKFIKSYVSTTNDNGKASSIYSSAISIHSKMSLHAFGSRSAGYSRIWRNNIKKIRSRINKNILAITLDASVINDADLLEQVRLALLVLLLYLLTIQLLLIHLTVQN